MIAVSYSDQSLLWITPFFVFPTHHPDIDQVLWFGIYIRDWFKISTLLLLVSLLNQERFGLGFHQDILILSGYYYLGWMKSDVVDHSEFRSSDLKPSKLCFLFLWWSFLIVCKQLVISIFRFHLPVHLRSLDCVYVFVSHFLLVNWSDLMTQ